MVRHSRAVSRAAKRAVVVGDMPFLSYQVEPARAVENAGRFLAQGGCAAVKVEGGRRILPAVEAILAADIPVMGHVGLTPQSYRKLGGFKVQGREADSAREILEDAQALASAGCFAVVLECVPETLAAEITREIPVPTLGIGAGAALRRSGARVPRRHRPDARPAAEVRAPVRGPGDRLIGDAARAFTKDVKSGAFPSQEESFTGGKPTSAPGALNDEVPARIVRGACANTIGRARRAGPARCDLPSSRRWARFTRGTSRSCGSPREDAPFTVVSMFVNPLQFAPSEDFSRYPRREEDDARAPRGARASTSSTCPTPRAFYPPDFSTAVEVGGVTEGGEGARRPGHFRGVATVVSKLLLQVLPDVAVFGRKDLQQVAVIRRLIRDLDFPIRLVVGETVREPDGLAMSSRNAYLSPDERRRATDLSRTLFAARGARAPRRDGRDGASRRTRGCQLEAAGFEVDYVEAVDDRTRWRRADDGRAGRRAGRGRAAREDAPDRQRFPPRPRRQE